MAKTIVILKATKRDKNRYGMNQNQKSKGGKAEASKNKLETLPKKKKS